MVKLSLMASAACSPAMFYQELGLCRAPKNIQALLPGPDRRQEILRSSSLKFNGLHLEEPCDSISQMLEYNNPERPLTATKKAAIIDVQDSRPEPVLFSFGIAEQCTRHEKILQFLKAGENAVEEGLNISLISDHMGLQTLAIDMSPQPILSVDELSPYELRSHPFISTERQFYIPKPLLDFVGDMSRDSKIMVHPDGPVLFTGTGDEMKGLLSIISKFSLPKDQINGSKRSVLVPYFRRWSKKSHANSQASLGLQTEEATTRSPQTVKLKSPQKKQKTRKSGAEREVYRKDYFQACESLLSFIVDEKGTMAVQSLKKSSLEISEVLTQFSASIAGIGLAVLFSVVYKMGSGRVPFCTTKLLNTSFGLGLFWLSSAVNGLRDTIIHISKNSSKLKEEDISQKVEQSVKEALFRAAALMAVVLLRFA